MVRRAKLILAASGVSNAQISLQLELERGQVRQWRQRWLAATPQLSEAEAQGISNRKLRELITFHSLRSRLSLFESSDCFQLATTKKRSRWR